MGQSKRFVDKDQRTDFPSPQKCIDIYHIDNI